MSAKNICDVFNLEYSGSIRYLHSGKNLFFNFWLKKDAFDAQNGIFSKFLLWLIASRF